MTKEEEYEYRAERLEDAMEIYNRLSFHGEDEHYEFNTLDIEVLLDSLDDYISQYKLMLSATAPMLEESKLYE